MPFTLQQPQLVEQTLARQREQERKAKQWQLRKRERVIKLRSCSEQARAPTQASINSPQHPEDPSAPFDPAVLDPNVGRVEAELLLAMSEPIGRDSAGRWPDNCQLGQAALQQTLPFPASSKANSLSALGLDLTPAPTTSDNGVQGPLDEQARAGSEVRIVGPLAPEVMLTQEMEQPVAPSGLPAPAMSSGSDAPQSHHVPIADMPPQQQQALAMKTSDTHPIK